MKENDWLEFGSSCLYFLDNKVYILIVDNKNSDINYNIRTICHINI